MDSYVEILDVRACGDCFIIWIFNSSYDTWEWPWEEWMALGECPSLGDLNLWFNCKGKEEPE